MKVKICYIVNDVNRRFTAYSINSTQISSKYQEIKKILPFNTKVNSNSINYS